jgi:hypothetical protein
MVLALLDNGKRLGTCLKELVRISINCSGGFTKIVSSKKIKRHLKTGPCLHARVLSRTEKVLQFLYASDNGNDHKDLGKLR